MHRVLVVFAPASYLPVSVLLMFALLAPTFVLPAGADPQTPEQRMQARYPQTVRVGDIVGRPILDDSASTLGHVRKVVRTDGNKIALIVDYRGFFDWHSRPVAVPLEVVGIAGRHLTSLDMPRRDYIHARTWEDGSGAALPADATIKIALSRH